jgi:hypothetical protein
VYLLVPPVQLSNSHKLNIEYFLLGTDIDDDAGGDDSGWSVSLFGDGMRVAIGAPFDDRNG